MQTTIIASPYRGLINEELFERLVGRVKKDYGYLHETAECCIDETLGYLKLCATETGPYVPCDLVDNGWHTFLLYTREYIALCKQLCGHIIHHAPNDDMTMPQLNGGIAKTVEGFLAQDIAFNAQIWLSAQSSRREWVYGMDCDGGTGPGSNCTCS